MVGGNDPGTMKQLQLSIKETPHYGVILGSEKAVQGKGVREGVEIQLDECTVKDGFLSLELGGVDIILGMQWVVLLGSNRSGSEEFASDIPTSRQKSEHRGGSKAIELKEVSTVELNEDEDMCAVGESLPAVLEYFANVFAWSEKLPSNRSIGNHRHLKKDINPINIWSDISMDFVEGLPKAHGFEVIFVVVDRLSKYGHFLSLKHPYTAKTVADVFIKEIVRLHGFPSSIVSDRDEVVYGRQPPPLVYYGERETSNSTLDEQLRERDVTLGVLKEDLRVAQENMKKYADKKRRDVQHQVGVMVFLKLKPYRQLLLRKKRNKKLSPKFSRPYKVIEKIDPVAYKLELPFGTSVHPVFHVSQRKKMIGEHVNVHSTTQYLTETHEWKVVPEEGLECQKHKSGNWEVLISWEGLLKHEATWERYEELQLSRFSH
ncbi:Transposon Ty3-I Gag-Pol polyprotein [Cucumis melo var. makuwa]|uniref:Transposon Ty3-I Gag-Pol polyprotein n=1 Tax=Cucumis melo var. makuwa TaxID=1194695 RepID=A0A5D3CSX6_CUCMM|nr:Transposon Ty3-I Gag-Pol polyprotein [Cucumis melo var. makuwa]